MADDAPKTLAEKIGAALPIALTAIATAFAGLSSSEMSRAMFWRSVAAQDQAKAGSQWNFAGFKRDRALMAENTAAILKAGEGAKKDEAAPTVPVPAAVERVRAWMQAPEGNPPPTADANVQATLTAILQRNPEAEVVRIAGRIKPDALDAAIAEGHTQANAVEAATDGKTRTAASSGQLELDEVRYKAESTMNFWVGYLYEVRVRVSVFQSDRHRTRSENFFYAMLAAQVGATVASLALARRTGNVLWLLAAGAGTIAVGFGAYVYLTF